jgi:hypothetical protein
MSKLFSQMLEEMGFSLPSGRERFNRPMPRKSSEVDISPNPDDADTMITPDGVEQNEMDDMVPFDLGDDQIVVMSAKALRKLLGGSMDVDGNVDDSAPKLGFDDLPSEDDLFGDPDSALRGPKDGSLGGLGSEEEGKLSSEEDFGDPMADLGGMGDGSPDGVGFGNDSEEDPDRQGTIRSVKGAKLIFKRQQPDGTFAEMWAYNVGQGLHETLGIKRAILAGTDIPENHFQSPDGQQRYKIVTMGNAQLIKIEGLPN